MLTSQLTCCTFIWHWVKWSYLFLRVLKTSTQKMRWNKLRLQLLCLKPFLIL